MGRLLDWIKRFASLLIALAIAVVFSTVHFIIETDEFEFGFLSQKGFIHELDLKALDLKFRARHLDNLPAPKVVVAAIDEVGVEKYGLWPWPRNVIGDFITAATKGGAKVIAFDAVFSDEARNASFVEIKKFLDTYRAEGLAPESKGGKALAAQLQALQASGASASSDVGNLKATLGERGDPKAKGALTRAKKSSERLKSDANAASKALGSYLQRAARFEQAMAHLIEIGSPDAALERAIAASPQTILGYINFAKAADIVGVDKASLARAAKNVSKVAIDTIYEETYQEIGDNRIDSISPVQVNIEDLQITPVVAMRAPLPRFGEVAAGFGYFNVVPDPDGPMRRVRTLNKYEGKLYPALSLLAAARYLEADIRPINGSINPGRTIDGVRLGELMVPTNFHGHLLINYYQDPAKYFKTYSVADFIEGKVPPEDVKDKIILFGMTALGLFDQRPTPFSATTPGVYIHATAIQNIIDRSFLERFLGIALVEILAYILLGLLMGLVLPRVPPWAGAGIAVAFAVGLYWFDILFVFSRGTWMLTVLPTLQVVVTFIGVSLYGFLTEGREKRKIRKAFQFYLTKSVVDEMLKEPEKLKLGGEKRVCTVLFSDIRGFTTISERLTPEQLSNLLNEYLTPMTNLVFKYDGTLDKYMGDAIMAIFGAPVSYEDHAARACHCALDMMEDLAKLQAGWREDGVPELDIGIGLNTGDMAVGNMGSEIRFDYTVMGDNVNLGSRLEGINKQYGTNIIISSFTRQAAGERIHARELDSVRVKGKREPVVIYELLGKGAAPDSARTLIETFEGAIGLYKRQEWDAAIEQFDKIRTSLKANDFASNMYVQRCLQMKAQPPGQDWDGVFTMTTK